MTGTAGEAPKARAVLRNEDHTMMTVKITWSLGLSSALNVCSGGDGNDGGLADLPCNQAGIGKTAIANSKIDPFLDQIACPLRNEHLDQDLGITLAKGRKSGNDVETGKGMRCRHANYARGRGLPRSDAGFSRFEITNQLYSRFVEVPPGVSEAETAGGTPH